jgi:hypothetical protein
MQEFYAYLPNNEYRPFRHSRRFIDIIFRNWEHDNKEQVSYNKKKCSLFYYLVELKKLHTVMYQE